MEKGQDKKLIKLIKEFTGCSYDRAMDLLGIFLEETQKVYMQGYYKGYDAAKNENKKDDI